MSLILDRIVVIGFIFSILASARVASALLIVLNTPSITPLMTNSICYISHKFFFYFDSFAIFFIKHAYKDISKKKLWWIIKPHTIFLILLISISLALKLKLLQKMIIYEYFLPKNFHLSNSSFVNFSVWFVHMFIYPLHISK